jgi:hypothetical protein
LQRQQHHELLIQQEQERLQLGEERLIRLRLTLKTSLKDKNSNKKRTYEMMNEKNDLDD